MKIFSGMNTIFLGLIDRVNGTQWASKVMGSVFENRTENPWNQFTSVFLPIVFMSICVTAYAEGNCPQGYYPIGSSGQPRPQGCAPIPSDNQDEGQSHTPVKPVQWASKWGAIATDSKVGGFGASTDMSNQKEAETAAISECRAHGGTNCQVETWYSNRCAAMVIGDHFHSTNNAHTKDEAIKLGMETCGS